jgi:adenosylmethionine-8-amino-7-oxononanoate aminotransferase
MAAQGIAPNQEGFGPHVPDVIQVPHHDLGALEQVFAEQGHRVAAVITEPIQAAGGVFPPPDGYLPAVRALCDQHGAFLIADEVVCGFGRLGTWWGMQHYGVVPDLVTFAKAITSGYVPLGGCVVGPAVRARLEATPGWLLRHGHTYSGHPTACAAGLACLDVTVADGLLERAPAVGARLSSGLRRFLAEGRLKDVRGAGAVWGAVCPDGVDPNALRDALLARGVIARPINDLLALCPPLVIEDAQIDRILEAFDAVLPR